MNTPASEYRSIYAELLNAERAVIAACLMQPKRITEIAARLLPEHIVSKVHAKILSCLVTLAEDGRTPSVLAVASALGDDEIEPGLSLRKYLLNLTRESIDGMFIPWEDAVEVVIEQSHRRRIAAIGGRLSQGADIAVSLNDLVAETAGLLDDVTITMRRGKRFNYDAGGAGQGALDRLDSGDRGYPSMGLENLNAFAGGWPLGQLSVLSGRPGSGKSAVATSTLLHTAKVGNPAIFFSLEMVKEQLGARMLTDLAYDHTQPIYYEDVLNRRIDQRARQRLEIAQAKLAELPLHIEEQRGLTVSEIAARSRKIAAAMLRKGQQLRVIFVDHMMLVRSTDRYSGNRVREIGEISEGLNELAQELDVAMVALCQLNRQVEGRESKRPMLSDLRDSGEIEQNASLVMFLYRPAYYLARERSDDPEENEVIGSKLIQLRNKLEFIVDKNRNGRVGVVDAFVDIGANAVRNASFCVSA